VSNDVAVAILRALMKQLEAGTWKDQHGHDLKLNVHYIRAKQFLGRTL
jgi:hypothetical protein